MNPNDDKNDKVTTTAKIVTGSKREGKKNKRALVIIGILCFFIITISFIAVFWRSQSDTSNTPVIQYEETVTPNAYGHALGARLTGFYLGGNANGVDIPAHNYYPSVSDFKNPEWTKEHMQLSDDMNELIANGTVTYEARGCDNSIPSGEDNKCTSFILKSGDDYTFDSEE